jgi:hypothetical protein
MGWISVKDRKPEGDCIVRCEGVQRFMSDEKREPTLHVAKYHPNIVVIGNHFEFDMPKVTHWLPISELPTFVED